MPEYLAPGVFVEEVPPLLRAIEGVSTSTAGFVGPAERGPVAGFPPPFNGDAQQFPAVADPAPVLVTSLSEFNLAFGNPLPLPDPSNNGYLARAAKGFFENGGKRLFISRIVFYNQSNPADSNNATRGQLQAGQGTILRLARAVRSGDTTAQLTSLRGVSNAVTLEFRKVQDPGNVVFSSAITSFNVTRNEVALTTTVTTPPSPAPPIVLDPNTTFVTIQGLVNAITGPLFHARNPGAWSGRLRAQIFNADRGPVAVTGPAAAGATTIQVQSTGSFYRGAIIQIANTAAISDVYEVADILPGNVLSLQTALVNALTGVVNATTGVAAEYARVLEIDIVVTDESGPRPVVETYRALTWNQRNDPTIRSRHYASAINPNSGLVYVQPPGADSLPGTESADLPGQPMSADGGPVMITTAGGDGQATGDADYIGVDNGPGLRTGIQALQDVEDVRIIAAPGRTAGNVQNELINQAERLRYRFAVLDGEQNPAGGSVNAIMAHRNLYDTSYAAYYTPWFQVVESGQTLQLPPSGHIAGVYAGTDITRGVFKAPANQVVAGITGLRSYLTTGEQEILNPRGINCTRRFEGLGLRVWGARTLSSDPSVRYVNVRRYLIFLEASLDRGTQFAVFEPNSPPTWSRIVDSVSSFLQSQWLEGALFGRRPEDAYFVYCDERTMTADDVQNGRLICEIGVAIVRPAEFVIFRIEQITGFGNEG